MLLSQVMLDPDTGVLTISGEREVDDVAPDDAGADMDLSAAAGDTTGDAGAATGSKADGGWYSMSKVRAEATPPRHHHCSLALFGCPHHGLQMCACNANHGSNTHGNTASGASSFDIPSF